MIKTILLVMAIHTYGADDNTIPFVIGAYDTLGECNEQLAKTGWSFQDGYELGNMVVSDDADEYSSMFCVSIKDKFK